MGRGTSRRNHHRGRSGLELAPHLPVIIRWTLCTGTEKNTLGSSMHDNLRCKLEEDKLEQAQCEPEGCPVMSVLHNFQRIPIEVNITIKVHIMECLHWDLIGSAVFELVGLVLEGKVMFDGAAWNGGLFILAGTEGRGEVPETDQNRDCREETEEDAGLQSAADFPGQIPWDECNEGDEEDVGEALVAGTISRQRSILDCRVLCANISICSIELYGGTDALADRCGCLFTYRRRSNTTGLEFLEGRGGSFGGLNELELALRAIDALGLGRHDCCLPN